MIMPQVATKVLFILGQSKLPKQDSLMFQNKIHRCFITNRRINVHGAISNHGALGLSSIVDT